MCTVKSAQINSGCPRRRRMGAQRLQGSAAQPSWADGLIITWVWSPVLLRVCWPQVALRCD